jgi:tRNA dimethylallyltransferase
MSPLPRVVAVVGPTATGKTALAEALARQLGGEVVCADSRQVFRDLEIGTGKPTPAERAQLPHHLFDALELGQRRSAGWYAGAAAAIGRAIHARGRTAVLVGGSGLYLAALQRGLSAEPPHDPAVRARLRAELAGAGPEALHRRLAACDPGIAARLSPGDSQRITRALEVFEASGRPLSWWHGQRPAPPLEAEWRIVELAVPPALLSERIARRTRWMFESGLVEETRGLIERGLAEPLRSLRAVGYDEALDLIEGRISLAEARERTDLRTRQLAKRQRTWFRHQLETLRLDAHALGPEELLAVASRAATARGAGPH